MNLDLFSVVAFFIGLNADGTIHDLKKERRHVVKKSFVDNCGQHFEIGQELTFRHSDYWEHPGGYVLSFEGRKIYLLDEQQAEILQRIWEYLEPARQ
jgi:hypothetical protein